MVEKRELFEAAGNSNVQWVWEYKWVFVVVFAGCFFAHDKVGVIHSDDNGHTSFDSFGLVVGGEQDFSGNQIRIDFRIIVGLHKHL